jgi:transcriptional regulator with XRE-family HTH domain
VSEDVGNLTAQQVRLEVLRSGLGAQLAIYRTAAGISQPELGRAIGRTRSMVSRIEHGTRALPEALWKITDELCRAEGVLIAAHAKLMQAEVDYRARRRIPHRQIQPMPAQQGTRRSPWPVPAGRGRDLDVAWLQETRVDGALAEELLEVVIRLVQSMGRREAMRLAGSVLAAVGLSGLLDADEYLRVAQAVISPSRVDAQVIKNLAVTLAVCKRQEDKLGPCQVLDTVVAQHRLVRRLLAGDCPQKLYKALSLVDSNMAATIGGYLIDMGQPEAASRYFTHARRAAHNASNTAYATYAAINTSFAARLRVDVPTALDSAAASRSLAARTDDAQLKALAEQMAAGAHALDGQYGPCMSASARAHDFLTNTNGNVSDSPAYWVHHGIIDDQASNFLALLGKPEQAVEAAYIAQAQYDRTYVARYALCQVRLGHALVLSKDITHAAHVLGDAASQAHLYPRLTTDLHIARAMMQPWSATRPVKKLDAQLEAYGLMTTTNTTPESAAPGDQQA